MTGEMPDIVRSGPAGAPLTGKKPFRPRQVGFWEAAILKDGGIKLVAWALDTANNVPPREYVLHFNKQVYRFADLVVRPDVARANGLAPLACGLKAQIAVSKASLQSNSTLERPTLLTVWSDGTELVLLPLNSKSDGQFFWNELGIPEPTPIEPQPEPETEPAALPSAPDLLAPRRYEGFWEQATFTTKGVMLAAWALETNTQAAPVAFEFRWGAGVARVTEMAVRDDVERALGRSVPACGLSVEIPFSLQDIPDDAHIGMPTVVAIWADGSETEVKPSDRKGAIQFRYLAFDTRQDFIQHFQNPAFRVKNGAVVAWAAQRALTLFENDIDLFMSAFCVMIYRHLENGFFSASEILKLSETWERLEATIPSPIKGERLRWVISVKLALGYFFMVRRDQAKAAGNFTAITLLDEHLASWPQASTNILIGVFMAAWFDYRAGDTATAIVRLGKAYTVFKNGVTYLPVWSKHHFSELDNSLRIAGECFGFQKLLEGEKREHILPLTTKLTFIKISIVLRDLIARGQIEDGPFPERGE